MTQPKGTVSIETDRCKGCGLCISVCPVNILVFHDNSVNTKGYKPATIIRPLDCTGCGNCSLMCPDSAITVKRTVRKRRVAHV